MTSSVTPGSTSDEPTTATDGSATGSSTGSVTTTGVTTTDPTITTTGSTTDPSSTTDATASSSSTSTTGGPACGDGVIDPGETCDDGAANADDGACTAACQTAICGDMLVQAGVEDCDDGNMDDTDACVAGCKNATCGDGFVGPAEMCDDGNMIDDDACGNNCAPGSCGDGKLQMGEECDDGNMVDTDTCLNSCFTAKCGDMVVQDMVDQCDDGNMSNLDMCTNTCKTPTCMDAIQSGLESDVDCGGPCSKCAAGKACFAGNDCGSGQCTMNKCTIAPSCKAIKTGNAMAADGVYNIDPDGAGPIAAFDVYCDMTTDGGGWTLVLKADGSKDTLLYDNVLWTNNLLLNANQTALDRTEAKFSSWNTVPFTDVLVGLEAPILANGPLTLKTQKVATGAKTSMFALMSPNTYSAPMVAVGRVAWKALIAGGSLQLNCNREGFNVPGQARVRIGIQANEQNDCNSPDSYIGVGGQGAPCAPGPQRAVGNVVGCGGDNGEKSTAAFGVVFVR
jgi:cysteine-rich repeat protein